MGAGASTHPDAVAAEKRVAALEAQVEALRQAIEGRDGAAAPAAAPATGGGAAKGDEWSQAVTQWVDFVKLRECVPVLQRYSDVGDALARGCIATALWGGVIVPKDQAASKAMFEDGSLLRELRAVAEGDGAKKAEAAIVLGHAYDDGFVGEQNTAEGIKWYTLAADSGNARGHVELSRCFSLGTSVDKDPAKAFHHAKLAADAGSAPGLFQLGTYFLQGVGVEADPAKCAHYSKLSADMDCCAGQFGMGMCYEQGISFDKDLSQAAHFYQLAVDQDFPMAAEALERVKKAT